MSILNEINKYAKSARNKKANIGVFAVGHFRYWPQFPELKNTLMKHYQHFCETLRTRSRENIIDCKIMSDEYSTAMQVVDFFERQPLDMIICYVATYSPAVCAMIVLNKIAVPSLIVCFQPSKAMDYPNATTQMQLENDNITSVPEIIYSLNRAGKEPLDCIIGSLYNDGESWDALIEWCEVAHVVHHLKNAHIGYMGQGYEGMLDMNSDLTMFDAKFGMHIEHIEIDVLGELVNEVNDRDYHEKLQEIIDMFDMPDPGADPIATKVKIEDLDWPARVAVGMDKLMIKYNLDGLAYHYRGSENSRNKMLIAGMIIGNSLLTGKGLPIAGELDIKNCVAMLIMDRFGAGGSFAEIHPIDFSENFVLIGHDGPHHVRIADGKPVLRNLSILHGKTGYGPSVEFKLKVGDISMLGLTHDRDGEFKFVFAKGLSCPGMIPATGNTNTRGRFEPDVKTFLRRWSLEGPTHHFALGIGDLTGKIEKLAQFLNIKFVNVTP